MTVLAIPFLTGLLDFERCLRSIDIPATVIVIDNSARGLPTDMAGDHWYIEMPNNLGVAASWNLAIKAYPAEPFWLIANHDTVFAPGDLARLVEEMQKPGPRWVGMNGDWRVFGINAECIETVGWFDENFAPIYCEDADYEYRCRLLGVPYYFLQGDTTHAGSASIKDPRYGQQNQRTYPLNRDYYRAKWGGDLRGGETFTSPFNKGGSCTDWALDLRRLREQRWT